jgi:hypothetical protein
MVSRRRNSALWLRWTVLDPPRSLSSFALAARNTISRNFLLESRNCCIVALWDKTPSAGISKAEGPIHNPHRRLGRGGASRKYLRTLKPRNPLKRLISDERIQGNPNQKSLRRELVAWPDRGSPRKSKSTLAEGAKISRFAPCNPLKRNDRRRLTADNGGKRRPFCAHFRLS